MAGTGEQLKPHVDDPDPRGPDFAAPPPPMKLAADGLTHVCQVCGDLHEIGETHPLHPAFLDVKSE